MNKVIVSLLMILALLTGAVQAGPVEIIQLQNRPASDIIPIVKPMLDAGASVSGDGFKLMVRTSKENLEQIKRIVNELDQASKQLLISVFQGNDRDLRAIGVSGGLRYQGGKADVSVGDTRASERGGSVQYSTRDATVGGSTLSTRGRLTDNPVHQLRITEGTQGYIETGESIPYFSGGVWLGARRRGVDAGVDYKDVHTGFYVLPRVHGERVTLDVSPYKQNRSKTHGGAIDTQSASTKVTGRLGQWLPIGGVTEQTGSTSSGIGTHSSTRNRNNESIWIKADLVQ